MSFKSEEASVQKENKKDLITGVVFLGISLGIFAASFSIKKLVVSFIGSSFVPQVTALLLAGLSVLLIIQSLSDAGAGRTARADGVPHPDTGRKARFSTIATFVLLFCYLFFLESVGFLITTAVYLFAQFWVLSKKKPNLLMYALIAVLSSVIIYYIFVKIFILMLPAGIFG